MIFTNEDYREVRYDLYCSKCKHYDENNENKEPCEECSDEPARLYSEKPAKFEEM